MLSRAGTPLDALIARARAEHLSRLGPGVTTPRGESREGACCERAVKRACVCVSSWICGEHGVTCNGSHD